MSSTAHDRWLRRVARDAARERLTRARQAVKDARDYKRTARQRAREACTLARQRFAQWKIDERARVKAEIERLRVELRNATAERAAAVKQCCGPDKRAAKEQGDARIAEARAQLAELMDARKREIIWTQPARRPGRSNAAIAAAKRERAEESDHEVEVNLSPDELIVWQRVKSKIRGTDRMSRTEAFQHWLHDHSSDVAEILADDAERAYQQAIRDEAKERKALAAMSKASPQKLRQAIATEIGATLDDEPPAPGWIRQGGGWANPSPEKDETPKAGRTKRRARLTLKDTIKRWRHEGQDLDLSSRRQGERLTIPGSGSLGSYTAQSGDSYTLQITDDGAGPVLVHLIDPGDPQNPSLLSRAGLETPRELLASARAAAKTAAREAAKRARKTKSKKQSPKPADLEHVDIRYGVEQDHRGFYPILKTDERPPARIYSRPLDRDDALERAREAADEHATRYTGDWHVTINQLPLPGSKARKAAGVPF